jgi:endoglucanase
MDGGKSGLTRRDFLGLAAATTLMSASPLLASGITGEKPVEAGAKPSGDNAHHRKCGFNLHNMFYLKGLGPFEEHDFRWMRDWGFNFVGLPLAYQLVVINGDPYKPDEWWLAYLDRGLEYAQRYRLQACVRMVRAPGFPSWGGDREEPYNLWKDQQALDAFCHLWRSLAQRYKGIPTSALTFNLLNEPPPIADQLSLSDFLRVIGAAVAAIREVDPDRPINTDGPNWGNIPCPELKDLAIGQSCHIYAPFELTHYRASWMKGSDTWPEPVWPNLVSEGYYTFYGKGIVWNRQKLEEYYQPWFELAKQGVWIHVGEMGAYNRTPHPVVLAWMRDVLEMLTAHHIGWALWNFRGEFGILDSGRSDVDYEDFHGHKLDRKLLRLLQEFK